MMRAVGTAVWVLTLSIVTGCAEPVIWKDPETVGDEGGQVLPCSEVEPGVLYRSGQPDKKALELLNNTIGIKTIVNARGGPRDRSWYRNEADFAKKHGIKLVNMDVSIANEPTPEQREQFLELLRNPENLPILVHCRWGVHRTGHLVRVFLANRDELVKTDRTKSPATKKPA